MDPRLTPGQGSRRRMESTVRWRWSGKVTTRKGILPKKDYIVGKGQTRFGGAKRGTAQISDRVRGIHDL